MDEFVIHSLHDEIGGATRAVYRRVEPWQCDWPDSATCPFHIFAPGRRWSWTVVDFGRSRSCIGGRREQEPLRVWRWRGGRGRRRRLGAVRGGNPVRMVAQEGRPTLTRPPGPFDHVVPVANLISESKHGVSGLSPVPSSPCSRSCQPSFRCSPAGFAAEAPSNWRWWPSGTSWPCFGANTPADPVSVLGIGFSGLCCTDSGRNASRSWCW